MTDPAPSDGSQPNKLGTTLGNYRLLSRLGRGGMAEVYLADQTSLNRQVAIKVLKPELAEQPDYVRRFHNEARAVAALVHANIVQIYEVGNEEGTHFIAQEYVPGQTVKQLVTRQGALDVPRVISVLRQMAAALSKANQGNIVHRDIKPENILLTRSGEVKVADFGLARVMDPQNVDLTQAGITMGTPLYMSPEQIEGKSLDHRSDLYSTGVTAFFMLTSRPPFQGDTPLSVAVQHLQNEPPALADQRPDAPELLVQIVEKLLRKNRDERFSSASELLQELRKLPLDDWDSGLPLEDDSFSHIPAVPSGGLEATQQLQNLLDTQAMPSLKRSTILPWVSALVGALAVGAALAAATWQGPLLQLDDNLTSIDAKATAKEQYYYATLLNTVEGWESVAKLHPPGNSKLNRHYAYLAMTQLAWRYLSEPNYDRAQNIYQELSEADPNYPESIVNGHAGLAVIYHAKNDAERRREHLVQVISENRGIEMISNETLKSQIEKLTKELTQQ